MTLGDREFTSEEVAEMCGVTRVTVADWITRGRLSVRWTTGGHRRIPRGSLAAFMREQGYSLPRSIDSARALTVVMHAHPVRQIELADVFDLPGEFDVERMVPGIDALLTIGAKRPDVLVFATRAPGFDTPQFIESLRLMPTMIECALVAVMTHEEEASALRRLGVDIITTMDRLGELRTSVVRWLTEHQRRVVDEMADADRSGPRRARHVSSIPPTLALDLAATK